MLVADRLIFLPPPASYRAEQGVVMLDTADGGRIAAVHLPLADATHTILYSHGNAEDLGHVRPVLETIRRAGFAVFAYDYRGYGLSAGTPSEAATYRDIDAAWTHLTERLGVPPRRVILLGRSVGAGPSVDLATRVPVGGLVLESAFVTAFRVLTRVPLLPFDKYRNIDKIIRVACPVLVIHGTADEVVPLWHGQRLFQAAREPKRALWVDGAGHNDLMLVAGARYGRALADFAALLER
jgi:fermentation-respiration switch protein FrsA (DUF1100 family)